MRKFFDLENPIVVFLSRIADVVALSLLWFVFSLPVVTMGSAIYAMRRTFQTAVLEEETPLLKTFWSEFCCQWKRGLLVSAVYMAGLVAVLAIILGGYIYYADAVWIGAVYIFTAVPAIVWLGMMLYDFLLLVGNPLPIKRHLGISFVLTLRHLPTTIVMVVMLGAAVILSEMFPLAMLFLPAGFCWLTNKWLVKIENQYPDLLGEPEEKE